METSLDHSLSSCPFPATLLLLVLELVLAPPDDGAITACNAFSRCVETFGRNRKQIGWGVVEGGTVNGVSRVLEHCRGGID